MTYGFRNGPFDGGRWALERWRRSTGGHLSSLKDKKRKELKYYFLYQYNNRAGLKTTTGPMKQKISSISKISIQQWKHKEE